MEWLTYLLEVSACIALFYAFYYLFLQKLTFFSLNRIYLLSTLLVSFVVPALNLQIEESKVTKPSELYSQTARVDVGQGIPELKVTKANAQQMKEQNVHLNWEEVIFGLYIIGSLVALIVFLLHILYLLKHIRGANTRFGRLRVIYKPEGFTNCSFFNYVFVSHRDIEDHEVNILLHHERVHALKYHSVDKLLMIFCKVVLWFNPLVYLFDKSLEQVHEYEADKEAALNIGNASYAQLLLNMAVKKNSLSLAHSFVKNPLKERIKMLFISQSKNMKKLIYLTCAPLSAILLWSFSVSYVYKEPIQETTVLALPKEVMAPKIDTTKYRQKVKKSPQLLQSQKKYAEWRKIDESKKRLQSAFLYEVNKVRFADGSITGVKHYTPYDKELEVTANGYKFLVKVSSQQVDVKELNDFKKGDRVRLRFVHEVKSGAKSYTIADWVAISKEIKEYGVKNKEMFKFFYEKITNEKLMYSTRGSVIVNKGQEIVSLNGNATLQNQHFFIKADTIKLQNKAALAYGKNVGFYLPKDGTIIQSPYVKFDLKEGTYELLEAYDKF
nr:M56 family metallopeptidase [Pedobacter panaciterrae]